MKYNYKKPTLKTLYGISLETDQELLNSIDILDKTKNEINFSLLNSTKNIYYYITDWEFGGISTKGTELEPYTEWGNYTQNESLYLQKSYEFTITEFPLRYLSHIKTKILLQSPGEVTDVGWGVGGFEVYSSEGLYDFDFGWGSTVTDIPIFQVYDLDDNENINTAVKKVKVMSSITVNLNVNDKPAPVELYTKFYVSIINPKLYQ